MKKYVKYIGFAYEACAFQALKLVDLDENPVAKENSLIAICQELVQKQK